MKTLIRVFSEGFRFFFLAAGLFGVFAGVVWGLWLWAQASGDYGADTSYAMAPHLWHGHEMIFGYATAAMGGFFLTAVPNWTGTPNARAQFIAVAALLWLSGRVAMWYSGMLPPMVVALADLAFLPVLAAKIGSQLMRRPKPQNMVFLGFLTMLWVSNLFAHLEWTGVTDATLETGLRGGLITLCALISILGGRVTPAFTRNAMKRAGEPEARWPVSIAPVEKAAVILALGLPFLILLNLPWPVAPAVALIMGLVQIIRLAQWRWRWALRQPILIALHVGLTMLALGLILWGLAGLGIGDEIAALHVLGIGCVGGMTLAVMSRAVLGHSGRPLVAPTPVAWGYGFIAVAALLRWLGAGDLGDGYYPVMLGAVAMWTLAFAFYVISLWSALTAPRGS